MRRIALTALVPLALFIASCEQDPAPAELSEPAATSNEEIFGGTWDSGNTYPAVVWLYNETGGYSCSGTIVQITGSTGYVLTAAHCTGMEYVIVDTDYNCIQNDTCDQVYQVVPGSQQYDPAFDENSVQNGHDFSMLRISGVSGITPIPVATNPDGLKANGGDSVIQVGYGVTKTNQNNSKRNVVNITTDQVFSNLIYHDQTDGKGTCSGDSGGPTIFNGKVVGVTSFGDQTCASDGYDGRVQFAYNSFIAPYLNATVTETCDTCFDEEVNTQTGSCYSKVQACQDDTECNALNDCLNACGANDQSCVNACASAHQNGIDKFNAIFDCFCTSCASLCSDECAQSTTSATTGSGMTTSSNGAGGGAANGAGGASANGSGGSTSATGDSETDDGGNATSCNCSTPGAASGTTSGALGLAGVAIAIGAMRRRRRG